MRNQTQQTLFIYLTLLLLLLFFFFTLQFTNAAKIHIPDDLDDVVDDEEDDDWKNWGKKTPTPLPEPDFDPSDLDHLDPAQIQARFSKFQTGPVFGFVKLRLGLQRSPDDVSETAMKWTKVMKTGGLEVKFMGVDLSTIMFTMETSQSVDEVKEYILEQEDAYEVKIGDNVYRRAGDPPLEEVIEKLHKQKYKADL
ncbi:hypothetical protein RND81_02G124400 [Saponaria officinalis]|uniref:Mesoderm development candidate 2 n=1 Tax=Saponaria officinalis TaxID=3572 RepID=A0AAW1MME8_SAPOF